VRTVAQVALWCGLSSALLQAQLLDSAIAGAVVEDHSGAAVPGAVVRLFQLEGRQALQELETGRDGRFEFAPLPPGPYRVEIGKPTYAQTIVNVDAWRAAVDAGVAAIRLVRHGVIAGRPLPAGSAQIVAVEAVPAGVEPRRFTTRSESGAEFRLFDLPPGTYLLAAVNGSIGAGLRRGVTVYPGAAQPRAFAIAGGEELADLEVPIPSGDSFSVRGRVVAPDDGARQSVFLSLRATDHPWALVWSRLLPSDEQIFIENVVPGRYELTGTVGFGAAQRLSGKVSFDLGASDLANLELPLEPVRAPKSARSEVRSTEPAIIRGTVSGADVPVFVTLIDRTPGRTSPIRAALVRSGAAFAFSALAPGRYQVAAHAAAARDARWVVAPSESPEPVDLAAGDSKSIDLRLAGGRQ
jgi:hypothetical protein